jgi:hypothetical protein
MDAEDQLRHAQAFNRYVASAFGNKSSGFFANPNSRQGDTSVFTRTVRTFRVGEEDRSTVYTQSVCSEMGPDGAQRVTVRREMGDRVEQTVVTHGLAFHVTDVTHETESIPDSTSTVVVEEPRSPMADSPMSKRMAAESDHSEDWDANGDLQDDADAAESEYDASSMDTDACMANERFGPSNVHSRVCVVELEQPMDLDD